MSDYKLALLGFGNVGKALARLLQNKRQEVLDLYGISYSVTGIATGSHGFAIDPNGIDLADALQVENLSALSVKNPPKDTRQFIRECGAHVLFENSPVNYATGQPAIDYLTMGFKSGMHGITANKGPVVHGFKVLSALANEYNKRFYFESAVMDGAPVFAIFRETLPGANLRSFRGVLNSTTNMILTRMERGDSFDRAVRHCQEIGIAETDPSGDIDGWDAAIKVAALATVLMGVEIKPDEVDREGIRDITPEMILRAKEAGKRWKLVCSAELVDGHIRAKVMPEMVGSDSAMYTINGTTSIVQFETDVLGLLSVVEADPGPHTTAYGLFADFLNAVR